MKNISFDHLYNGNLSRREFIENMLAVGVLPNFSGQTDRLETSESRLSCLTWSKLDSEELQKQFNMKHPPAKFLHFDDETVSIKNIADNKLPNIIYPSHSLLPSWKERGLMALDESRLLHLKDIPQNLLNIPGSTSPEGRYFVPLFWGSTSFIYRSDLIELQNESWSALFDQKYRGKAEMWNSIEGIIPAASMALGYKTNICNPQGEQLMKVQNLLNDSCPHFRYFRGSQGNDIDSFTRGDVVIAYSWSGNASLLKQFTTVPFKWANPKEGTPLFVCGLSYGRKHKNQDQVYDFINAATSAASGSFIAKTFGYMPANMNAKSSMPQVDGLKLTSFDSQLLSHENISHKTRLQQISLFNNAKVNKT